MALELLFNAALFIFFIYCFIYVGVKAPENVPGQMDGAQWPQIILGLLLIFLAANIFKIIKNKKADESFKINFDLKKILRSKLFIGSALLIVYTYALDYIGFIVSSIIFFIIYSRLLGEKRKKTLIITSLVSVIALYVIFSVMLNIRLPRGTGLFRTFALFIENIL